jgi:hypothetical protein
MMVAWNRWCRASRASAVTGVSSPPISYPGRRPFRTESACRVPDCRWTTKQHVFGRAAVEVIRVTGRIVSQPELGANDQPNQRIRMRPRKRPLLV